MQRKKKTLHLQSQTTGTQLQKGAIAQLVEQRTENPCVAGSIPAGTTKKGIDTSSIPFLFYTLGCKIYRKACPQKKSYY